MAGKIEKGRISTIEGPADWYGHPTHARVNPCTNAGAVTMPLVIPWYLRGQTGSLKPEDLVCFCLFDDGTGVIIDRMDGEWVGVIDYDTKTTGDVIIEKTTTCVQDVHNKANVLTDLNTTIQGNMQVAGTGTATGTMTAKDFVTGSVGSYNAHTHTCPEDGRQTSTPNG